MKEFSFDLQRSKRRADQVPGVECNHCAISGMVEAESARDAWEAIKPMLVIPGVWICRMRCGPRELGERRITVKRRKPE